MTPAHRGERPSPRPSPLRGEGLRTLAPGRGEGRLRRRDARGFTLVELVLALSIAAAVLVIVFAGVRVGLAAWSKGEARAGRLDHARGVIVLAERALDGAFPYRFTPAAQQETRILFDGRPERVTFATLAPLFPAPAPIAFTAVSLSSEATGLALRQQALPDRLALDLLPPVLVDPETPAVRFRYLGEEPGAWQDEWDMSRQETLPRAVEITLVRGGGAPQVFTVPIRSALP